MDASCGDRSPDAAELIPLPAVSVAAEENAEPNKESEETESENFTDSDSHDSNAKTSLHVSLPSIGEECTRISNAVVVHVPSTCGCGCVVIGVWYGKVAHYCDWFRHPRYRALRAQFELKRRMNNDPVPVLNKIRSSSDEGGSSLLHLNPDAPHDDLDSAKSLPSLGPENLSLLCTFQLLRHRDALQMREACSTVKAGHKRRSMTKLCMDKDIGSSEVVAYPSMNTFDTVD